MLGNMLNDLAEAIRRWTEKKRSEISTSESKWIYLELESPLNQFEALFCFMTVGECFQKHSLYS